MKHKAFAECSFLLAFAAVVVFAAPESMAGAELKKAPEFTSFYRGSQADAQ